MATYDKEVPQSQHLHRLSVQQAQNAALGQAGSILIDDSSHIYNGPFVAITALVDATVDVSDCANITTTMINADADFTIPAGVTIYGQFAEMSLGSGTVIAYYG